MTSQLRYACSMEFICTLACGLDIVEVCGGDARPSQIAVRRQMPSGENFDLRNGYNLNDKRRQDAVWEYFKRCRPLVAVMAPTCTPFGPMSHLNYQINYDGWLRSYDLAAPHGRFCGRIALFQDEQRRYYLNEKPYQSQLYADPPWPYQ